VEGDLCRVGVDDECFVLIPAGSTDAICVPECPPQTEEEHISGVSTG
jgi:hypothetical protein